MFFDPKSFITNILIYTIAAAARGRGGRGGGPPGRGGNVFQRRK